MTVLGAPVFPHGNLAFFVAIFSEMTRLSAGVGLRLQSIHPSITRESKGGGERHRQTTGSSLKKWQQKTPDFRDGKLARQKQPLLCRIT